MLSKKMTKSLSHQVNREIYSGYLYLAMAGRALELGLEGAYNWFSLQMKEELAHAGKIYKYVTDQGARVELEAIEKPEQQFGSLRDMFGATLEHEKKVTAMISELLGLAISEKDRATEIMLQWFVTEQVEEEANASAVLQKLEIAGGDGRGLLMIDSMLGKRTAEAGE